MKELTHQEMDDIHNWINIAASSFVGNVARISFRHSPGRVRSIVCCAQHADVMADYLRNGHFYVLQRGRVMIVSKSKI